MLQEGITRLDSLPGDAPEMAAGLAGELDAVYRNWGKPERAAEWERKRPAATEATLARNERLLHERLDDPTLLTSKANLLFRLQRYGEAEAAYRAAIALKPHDASLHQSLGDACAGQTQVCRGGGRFSGGDSLGPERGRPSPQPG